MDIDSSTRFGPLKHVFQLPENPRDPYYSTNCFVCTAKSKPGSEFVNNYGAIVCFGCRAFWRRIHTNRMVSTLRCSLESSCALSAEAKSRCKSCRYVKCKVAGMQSEKIMTDEQKMKRFRKFAHKSSISPSTISKQDLWDSQQNQHENVEIIQNKSLELDDILSSEKKTYENQIKNEFSKMQSNLSSFSTSRCNDVLLKRIKFSHECFMETLGQKEIFQTWLPTSKDEFWSYIASITDEYQKFAEKHEAFNRLQTDSKSFLLLKNTQLFVQFYLVCNLMVLSPNSSQISYLEKLASLLSMFRPDSDVDYYTNLIHELTDFVECTTIQTHGMLAFIILLNICDDVPRSTVDDRSTLEELHVVNETFFLRFIRDHDKGLEYFIESLKKMSNFFDANF